MVSIKGILLFSLGLLLVLGGAYQSFNNIGALIPVVGWGVVAVIGVFALALGLSLVLGEQDETNAVDPENAPDKTDSPFGPR